MIEKFFLALRILVGSLIVLICLAKVFELAQVPFVWAVSGTIITILVFGFALKLGDFKEEWKLYLMLFLFTCFVVFVVRMVFVKFIW